MQGIHEFIIQIENPFKDTIAHGELELWVDSDFDRFQHSNRIGKVISRPLDGESPIMEGDEVLVVQTVVMPHISAQGRQDSPHMVDKEKGYYRVEPGLIVMYRGPNQEWRGYGKNVFLERIEKPEKEYSGLLHVTLQTEYEPYSRVAFSSDMLEAHGIKVGDKVFHSPDLHEYDLDGVIYHRTPLEFIYGLKTD